MSVTKSTRGQTVANTSTFVATYHAASAPNSARGHSIFLVTYHATSAPRLARGQTLTNNSIFLLRNYATSANLITSTSGLATSTNYLANSMRAGKRVFPSPNSVGKQPRSPKTRSGNPLRSQKGPRTYQGSEKAGTNPKKQGKHPRKQGLIYPPWEKNPFGNMTGITSEEPLIIVFAMMAFPQKGSPGRPEIIIHDLEIMRAQSTTRPRSFRDRGSGGY